MNTSSSLEAATWSARALKETSGLTAVLVRTFRFFASVHMAILVLLGLMVVFGAGTFIESYHGAETASILVYQSPWFSVLLFFLGLNLVGSAIDRLPWKKKHIGFVMTHLGIIII